MATISLDTIASINQLKPTKKKGSSSTCRKHFILSSGTTPKKNQNVFPDISPILPNVSR